MKFVVYISDLSFEPVQIVGHTLPSGLQAVNGSDDDGNCDDRNLQANGLNVCEDPNGIFFSPIKSVLVDGTTISTLNFIDDSRADDFFTVRRNNRTTIELGFELDTNDIITRVEVESLECPDRGIGASTVALFGMEDPDPVGVPFPTFNSSTATLLDTVTSEATSCSVQNHTFCIPMGEQPYRYYYLVFTFSNSDIDWLFLAEVRCLVNSPTTITSTVTPPTTSVTPAPSAILSTGIAVSTSSLSSALESSTTPTSESSPSGEPRGDNKDDDQTIVFVVVIIVIILAIVLVIVAIVILIVLIKVRRRHQKSQVEKLQSAMLEHETVELTSLKITTSQKESTDGTLTYKAPPTSNGRPDSIANPTYETPSDLKQPQTEGTVPSTEYSEINDSTTLPGYPYQDPDGDLGLPEYSTIPENGNGGELVTDTYAAVREITPQPKPVETLDVYAEVKSNDRPHEAPTVEELYTAVQKDPKPFIPEKSAELVEYLDTKSYMNDALSSEISNGQPRGKSPSRQIPTYQPPKLTTISKPVCDDMLTNLAYQSVEVDSVDNIYAEPSAQGEDSEQGIYETVYSEPIKPSLFTHDLSDSTEWQEDLQPYAPIYTVPIAPPKEEEKPLEVTDDNIREVHQLGTGAFGQVVLATTVGLSLKDLKMSSTDDDKTKSVLVAVKMLKPSASSGMQEIFQKEQKFMGRLKHENVIRLLGVCTTDTPFLMMEYMENGDLNQYLQKYKEVIPDGEVIGEDQIATSTLIDMAAQIASAMNYLASHNFVHRDLATRNCLVGQNNIIKIADFGMSRKLYDSHYYRIHGRAILPIRWMATECFYGKFSQKTDVWAFGVVMWEIFVLAKIQPYDGVQDQDIIQEAIKGKDRLLPDKPDACPDDVYRIMCECWEFEPSDRASFEELYTMLSSFNSQ